MSKIDKIYLPAITETYAAVMQEHDGKHFPSYNPARRMRSLQQRHDIRLCDEQLLDQVDAAWRLERARRIEAINHNFTNKAGSL